MALVVDDPEERWRLVLGDDSDGLPPALRDVDVALDFLYSRESADADGGADSLRGGDTSSGLSVPTWINDIHELFPRNVVEILERDALARYDLTDIVTNPDALRRAKPSPALLQAILRTKHLMNDEVLTMARRVVATVVEEITASLRREIELNLTGTRDPLRRVRHGRAADFDADATIRANLKYLEPGTGQLVMRHPIFTTRRRPQRSPWQIIVALDQSGSMADSVIHAAITAAIFRSLPVLRTHLVTFDTRVVDLSQECHDPVETLMQVQLGGGTDIAAAVTYCRELVSAPQHAILILITDLGEGGDARELIAQCRGLVADGVKVLVLGALTTEAAPRLNHSLANALGEVGVSTAVLTPDALAEWIAGVIA